MRGWAIGWVLAAGCGGGGGGGSEVDACVAGIEGPARSEIRYADLEIVKDGSEVGFGFAPQGGLYTPFFVRLWGQPELFRPAEVEGYGEVWAGWSIIDADDGTTLAEGAGSNTVTCVSGAEGNYLLFEFHAQYIDPTGNFWNSDTTWLEGSVAELTVQVGPLSEEVEVTPVWGTSIYAPDGILAELELSVVLVEGLPD